MDIEKVLERADVHWYDDPITQTRIVTSRNVNAPLTEEEQKTISRMWAIRFLPFKLEFKIGGNL